MQKYEYMREREEKKGSISRRKFSSDINKIQQRKK